MLWIEMLCIEMLCIEMPCIEMPCNEMPCIKAMSASSQPTANMVLGGRAKHTGPGPGGPRRQSPRCEGHHVPDFGQ